MSADGAFSSRAGKKMVKGVRLDCSFRVDGGEASAAQGGVSLAACLSLPTEALSARSPRGPGLTRAPELIGPPSSA